MSDPQHHDDRIRVVDAYEKHLLGLAEAERAKLDFGRLTILDDYVSLESSWDLHAGLGPTPADALAALLRDLDVDVPERPSAEWVEHVRREAPFRASQITALRNLYAREPLTVLALLEGGE